jgi:hypothetical protein
MEGLKKKSNPNCSTSSREGEYLFQSDTSKKGEKKDMEAKDLHFEVPLIVFL